MTSKKSALSDLVSSGVSVWMDDLTRGMIRSGKLETMLDSHHITGVTTNPSIFANAILNDDLYKSAIADLKTAGLTANKIIETLTIEDVQMACDVLKPVHEKTAGADGYVSIEVEPELAHDAAGTVARALEIWTRVNRKNLMVKIPATTAGVQAVSDTLALGINVNVTLIFGIGRLREVASAYLYGLEKALSAGLDIKELHSVASVFVSRFDTAVEKLASTNQDLVEVKHQVGVANAQLIQEAFSEILDTERYRFLLERGGNKQRLLWASTGVKTEELSEDFYCAELAVPATVNTIPESTLNFLNKQDSLAIAKQTPASAAGVIFKLTSSGVDYKDLCEDLEKEGLAKFSEAWEELLRSVGK